MHLLIDNQYDPEGQAIAPQRGAHEPLSIDDFGRVGSSPEIYLPIPLKEIADSAARQMATANAVAESIVATEMPQNSSERAWLPKLLMGILGMLSRLPFILDFSNI
jgi:hypothetical protein